MLDKIRALLAKAESTEFAQEAEVFTAKAQDLMTRHSVDEALLVAGGATSVEVSASRVLVDSPYAEEKTFLLNAVAAANRCRMVWFSQVSLATLVGTPVDVDQVEMLFTSLLIQATRAMAEAGSARAGSFDRSPTYRKSFLAAYGVRIGERLAAADQAATASYGTALVPVLGRQREAVEETFGELFPHTVSKSSGSRYVASGWNAGREAADRARLARGRITDG